jgi:hypothetical protein
MKIPQIDERDELVKELHLLCEQNSLAAFARDETIAQKTSCMENNEPLFYFLA